MAPRGGVIGRGVRQCREAGRRDGSEEKLRSIRCNAQLRVCGSRDKGGEVIFDGALC